MTDAETGQRGYLLTNNPNYLQPFHQGVSNAKNSLNQLQQLIKDNPSQQDRLENISFLRNFTEIDLGMKKAYEYLNSYVVENFKRHDSYYVRNSTLFKEVQEASDKAYKFQKFIRDNDPTEQEMKDKSLAIFQSEGIINARGLDIDTLELLEEIEAYTEPIKDLMNAIATLKEGNGNLSDTVLNQIQIVLKSEGLDKFKLTKEKQDLIKNNEEQEQEETSNE
jgi:hypothetical protein